MKKNYNNIVWISRRGKIYTNIEDIRWAHLFLIARLHPGSYHPDLRGRWDLYNTFQNKLRDMPPGLYIHMYKNTLKHTGRGVIR